MHTISLVALAHGLSHFLQIATAVVFYTVVVAAILTIATVLNLPGNSQTAKSPV